MDVIIEKIRALVCPTICPVVEEDVKTLFSRIEIDFSKNDIKKWNASGTDNVEIKVDGDYIAIERYSGNQGNASFKLQSKHGRELKFAETRKAYGKFNKIYVSNRFKENGTGDTSGKIVFFVGYLIGGEVEPAYSGSYEKRTITHTFKHLKPTTMTAANTAQALMTSAKVEWAIIHFLTKDALIGDSTVTRGGGAADGQKYVEGAYLAVENVNLNEIYIINSVVNESCIYTINYIEED